MPPARLSLTAQTLHAELMERLVQHEAARAIGHADGSFVTKLIKRREYVYFQHAQPGGPPRQVYLGPRSAALDALGATLREKRLTLEDEVLELRRLAAAFRAAGGLSTDGASARVLKALADGGVFAAGAVLVGTHAFIILGNMLGRRWAGAALRTHDVDIARGTVSDLDIAVDHGGADVPAILDSLKMGFLPVPELDRKHPHTAFSVRGKGIRVDLLAPGRKGDPPAIVDRFRAAAQPLDGIGYLVARPERGVVVDGAPVLVNVPRPARLALHKLYLSRSRPLVSQDKARKDLWQAAELLEALDEDRPDDLKDAWAEMNEHHPREAKRARTAANALARDFPAAHAVMAALMLGHPR